MAWDKLKPAGSQKVRLSDDDIRANNSALEDALARNHTFPGTEGDDAGEHTVIELADQAGDEAQEAGLIKLWNNAGALKFIVPSGSARHLDAIPSGTVMLFGQAAAPTGWTKKTDWTDGSMLVYTTGSPGAGGTDDPVNWLTAIQIAAEAAHTHTGPSHTHTGPSHTHSGPSHTHGAGSLTVNTYHRHNGDAASSGGAFTLSGNRYSDYQGNAATAASGATAADGTGNTGAGGTGATGAGGTGATGAGASHTHALTQDTFSPKYQQLIAATRD